MPYCWHKVSSPGLQTSLKPAPKTTQAAKPYPKTTIDPWDPQTPPSLDQKPPAGAPRPPVSNTAPNPVPNPPTPTTLLCELGQGLRLPSIRFIWSPCIMFIISFKQILNMECFLLLTGGRRDRTTIQSDKQKEIIRWHANSFGELCAQGPKVQPIKAWAPWRSSGRGRAALPKGAERHVRDWDCSSTLVQGSSRWGRCGAEVQHPGLQ